MKDEVKDLTTADIFGVITAALKELAARDDTTEVREDRLSKIVAVLPTKDMNSAVTILANTEAYNDGLAAYKKMLDGIEAAAKKRIGVILIEERKEDKASVAGVGEVVLEIKTRDNYVASEWPNFMEWVMNRELKYLQDGTKTVAQIALSFQGLFQKRLLVDTIPTLLEDPTFPKEYVSKYQEQVVKFKPAK